MDLEGWARDRADRVPVQFLPAAHALRMGTCPRAFYTMDGRRGDRSTQRSALAVLFLGVGWLFQLGGVALGFCLNGQVLRHYLGLPWDAIPQTGLCPEVVVRWLEGIELRSKPSKHTTGGNDPLFDPELDFPV